jgi:DNA-binding MarR family transcriptional regulator
MSIQDKFNHALRKWSETFIQRSMHETVRFMKESGLSMGQLSTLFRLYHGGICGVSDLGDHLGVTNAAASQMVDKLVQQGYLERTEDPDDRRVKQLRLTSKGALLVQKSYEVRLRWMEEITASLSPEQQEAVTSAISILTEKAQGLGKTNDEVQTFAGSGFRKASGIQAGERQTKV